MEQAVVKAKVKVQMMSLVKSLVIAFLVVLIVHTRVESVKCVRGKRNAKKDGEGREKRKTETKMNFTEGRRGSGQREAETGALRG